MTNARSLFALGAGCAAAAVAAACSGGGASAETKQLRADIARFEASSYRAEYNLTTPDDGEFPGGGTFDLFKDGPGRVRVDLKSHEDGNDVEITFLQTPEVSVFCFNGIGELSALFGLAPDEGVCLSSEESGETGLPLEGFVAGLTSIDDAGDIEASSTSTRTIAGETARCYATKGGGDASDLCFSESGVLLYGRSGDGSTFEATAVSGGPQSSDFEAPYEVRDLPDF